jgi:hypothetical protein
MTPRKIVTAALSLLTVATACAWFSPTSAANNGHRSVDSSPATGTNGGGKQYTVRITYTGDVKGSAGGVGGGSRVVSVPVPVKCWWEPAASFYRDPQAMYDWYLGRANAHSTSQYASEHFGTYQDYQAVIDKAKAGQKYYWYQAMCRDDADLAAFTNDSTGSVNYLKAFPVVDGEPTVPAPRVEPEQVALQAYKELGLVEPVLDRRVARAGRQAPVPGGITRATNGAPTPSFSDHAVRLIMFAT